jgi:type I pantothenate kinase
VNPFRDNGDLSPFRVFTREEWAALRADTPMTLTVDDLVKLQSSHDPISIEEVVAIYLPLSRLLSLYAAATQGLFKATQRFLLAEDGKVPYIIGLAGSVSAGKSTTARVLKALLSLVQHAEGGAHHHRRFSLPQCRVGGRWADGAQGISRKL